jgi:hypothetical protein
MVGKTVTTKTHQGSIVKSRKNRKGSNLDLNVWITSRDAVPLSSLYQERWTLEQRHCADTTTAQGGRGSGQVSISAAVWQLAILFYSELSIAARVMFLRIIMILAITTSRMPLNKPETVIKDFWRAI